jgi:hypothetical protein
MDWTLWTYDVAREQSPPREFLGEAARTSLAAGYDALGLYLEHRFRYPGLEWAHGVGAVGPEDVRWMRREFPALGLVPFVNVLSHMEGFLYCEEGQPMAEERMRGMQANPWSPGAQESVRRIVDGVLRVFDSEVVHLGGDEAAQLGRHADSARLMAGSGDGKARVYASHMGPLCERLLAEGRRPALWADMVLEHPEAAAGIPKRTLLFDWQYEGGCASSLASLRSMGFDVVGCPTVHVFDAAWCHLAETEANVRDVAADAHAGGAVGACLTTWEGGLFGSYPTVLPAVRWAGHELRSPGSGGDLVAAYGGSRGWAEAMGARLNQCGGLFAYDGHRNRLKCRLLLYGDPFLLWRHHGAELCGSVGEAALEVCQSAERLATTPAERQCAEFVRLALEFVRAAEAARQEYAGERPEGAVRALATARQVFDQLERIALRSHAEFGGSLADAERCRAARRHVEEVVRRVRAYGRRELGYLPAFEAITDRRFMPHDQACWWLVNRWGDA